jgi:hypothetical protein
MVAEPKDAFPWPGPGIAKIVTGRHSMIIIFSTGG